MTGAGPLRPRPGSGALRGPLVHLDRVGSTNDRARELAIAGAPDGTVVTAEEQTAGRGRQGRSWTAPRSRALTLSLVRRFRPQARGFGPSTEIELLPLAVALAVCDACEAVTAVACRIKWPNDIWVDQRKLAGILIETRPRDRWAVIGIGLNVDGDPRELDPALRETATSLRIATGAAVDRDRALAALLDALAARLEQLGRRGTEVLDAYRERDALRGRRISWSAGPASGTPATGAQEALLTGEAQGIDEHGNLIVFTRGGERLSLSAGEVHLEAAGQ